MTRVICRLSWPGDSSCRSCERPEGGPEGARPVGPSNPATPAISSCTGFPSFSREKQAFTASGSFVSRAAPGTSMPAMAPFKLVPEVFGDVLSRLLRERNWNADALANASGMSTRWIRSLQAGGVAPDLRDFIQLAAGLELPPVILLTEVINALRADPNDHGLYKSRPSDLARLHRLGYFRELPQVYASLDHATADARKLKVARGNWEVVSPDVVTIYIRVGYVQVDPRPETEEVAPNGHANT
jgi:transcriptional regulator with XRE-family HTH domain